MTFCFHLLLPHYLQHKSRLTSSPHSRFAWLSHSTHSLLNSLELRPRLRFSTKCAAAIRLLLHQHGYRRSRHWCSCAYGRRRYCYYYYHSHRRRCHDVSEQPGSSCPSLASRTLQSTRSSACSTINLPSLAPLPLTKSTNLPPRAPPSADSLLT
jgi:hypothetical protein